MKSNFLKNFFNSKEASSKENFNIHSLDLDETDDIVEPDNILSNMNFTKLENSKKANIFSFNDSICSDSSFEAKSPQIPKFKNFSMVKKSPSKSPVPKRITKCNTPNIPNFRSINKAAFGMKFHSPRSSNVSFENLSPMFMDRSNRKEKNVRFGDKEASPKSQNLPSKSNQSSKVNNQNSNPSTNIQKTKNNFQTDYNHENDFEDSNKMSVRKDFGNSNLDDSNLDLSVMYKTNPEETNLNEKPKEDFVFNPNNKAHNKNYYDKPNYDQTEEKDEGSDDTQLKALHMKLRSEAERINKWKTEMENDLSTKTKKINEYEKIIESLRSSNLELQMRQEDISINYQEEIETRTDIERKIDNSRQISQLLKDKIEEMENMQVQRTNENEQYKNSHGSLLKIVASMVLDIKSVTELQERLKNKIRNKNEEILKLTCDLTAQKEKVTDYEINMEKLNLNNSKLNEEISTLEIEKSNINEILNQTNDVKNELQCKIDESNELIQSLNNQIEGNQKEIQDLKISIADTNEQILKERDSNKLLEENLSQLKQNYEEDLTKRQEKIDEINLMVTSLEKELENKDIVILEKVNNIENMKSEFETKLKLKESSIDGLTSSILEREANISALNSRINQVVESNHELTSKYKEYETKLESSENNNEVLKLSNMDLRSELAFKSETVSHLETKIHSLNTLEESRNSEIESMKESFQIKENELDKVKKEYENNLKKKDIEIKKISEDNTKLNKQKLELVESMRNKDKNLSEEKTKSENNSVSYTLLEKETMVLKAQLADQIGEFEKLCSKNSDLETNNQVQTNKLAQLENKLKNFESLANESTNKILSLEAFVNELSNEKQKILKSREDLRKELMFTLEQCKNEYEIEEKKKNKEIENLKKQLDSQQNDNQANLKKSKAQLQEVNGDLKSSKSEINKLEKSLNQFKNDKNKLSMEVIELSEKIKEITNKSREIETRNKTLELTNVDYQNKIINYASQVTRLQETLENQEDEIIKYKARQLEIMENVSPPCTQLPESIKLSGSATPKRPNLSQTLNNCILEEKKTQKTPQKTPKSILRQPGSASKRRKVLFEEVEMQKTYMISDQESIASDTVEIDFEGLNNKPKKGTKASLNMVVTPKRQKLSIKGLTDGKGGSKLGNIRKTPCKTPKTRSEKKASNKDNWFDNENFFGTEV